MPSPAKVSPQSSLKKLILCIDDHRPGVRARKLILEGAGYRVLTASSGRIGLRLMRRHRVQFVILDYRMPKMDGEAVAREIRRMHPHIPVIMLSGQINLPHKAFVSFRHSSEVRRDRLLIQPIIPSLTGANHRTHPLQKFTFLDWLFTRCSAKRCSYQRNNFSDSWNRELQKERMR
jgi:CheY-like chemotaxis protein